MENDGIVLMLLLQITNWS